MALGFEEISDGDVLHAEVPKQQHAPAIKLEFAAAINSAKHRADMECSL